MEETIKCTCTNAIPVTSGIDPIIQANLDDTAKAMANAMNKIETPEEKVKKANNILKNFKDYIGSKKFEDDVKVISTKYNVPEKQLAQNFFAKVLGTIGDIFGLAVGTIEGLCHNIINLVGVIAHSLVNTICNIAKGIGRIVTLNQTCIPTCI